MQQVVFYRLEDKTRFWRNWRRGEDLSVSLSAFLYIVIWLFFTFIYVFFSFYPKIFYVYVMVFMLVFSWDFWLSEWVCLCFLCLLLGSFLLFICFLLLCCVSFCFILWNFILFYYYSSEKIYFLMRKESGYNPGGRRSGEELGRVKRYETIIRIHYR